jgi:hypothetical protein
MPVDAFKGEVEPVGDASAEPTCAVDGLLAVNPVRRPEKKSTDGERDGDE